MIPGRRWRGKNVDALLLGVILCGVFLRLFTLGQQGLFFDEAWSWEATYLPIRELAALSFQDVHPPLYYILLKGILLVLPDTEVGLRLFSAACSIAAQVCLMRFALQEWGRKAAVFSGLFCAFSSFDVYYAQETRMYTWLGLLWVVASITLVQVLRGSRRALVMWVLVGVAMGWTHTYGTLSALLHVALLLTYLVLAYGQKRIVPPHARWLVLSAVAVVGAIAPVLRWLFEHQEMNAGGAWIPSATDPFRMFLLASVGLTAVRSHFLDGAHLTLPALAAVPIQAWGVVGVLTSGIFAIRGLLGCWRTGGAQRMVVSLSVLLALVPIVTAFVVAGLVQQQWWAFKPFLGTVYLYYLWAGIGLSQIRARWIQGVVVVGVCVVSLLSLVPYYTVWQKSNSALAFRTIPQMDDLSIVLIEPAYLAPLARFYLGDAVSLWQTHSRDGGVVFQEIPAITNPSAVPVTISCKDVASPPQPSVWMYGDSVRLRNAIPNWPDCLLQAKMWLFENNQWVALNP